MNLLCITGFIHFQPNFERENGHKVINLTIKSIYRDAERQMATILNCKWYDPPEKYWQHPAIKEGTLIYTEGPLLQALSKNDESILNKTPHQNIKHFKIINTKEEYFEMQNRAVEQTSKKKYRKGKK